MDIVDWARLAVLQELNLRAFYHQEPMPETDKYEMNMLLDKTKGVQEHPEDWEWGCLCLLCCSYGV